MNKEEKALIDLVEYMDYLETYNKSNNWNKGYFKKLKKLLIIFLKEYGKNKWGWKF